MLEVTKKLINEGYDMAPIGSQEEELFIAAQREIETMENEPEFQTWTSIKDKQPPKGKSVLVCFNGIVQTEAYIFYRSYYDSKIVSWAREDSEHDLDVQPNDLWMPLPAPPKGQPDD